MKYQLSVSARADLRSIYRESLRQFGKAQADRYYDGFHSAFNVLTTFPNAGPERSELAPGSRTYASGSHLIIYQVRQGHILIVAVRHGREDWLPSSD